MTIELLFWLLSGLLLGVMGSVHCVGMCGGVVCALSQSCKSSQISNQTVVQYQLAYHAGRILVYILLGSFLTLIISQWMSMSGLNMGHSLRMIADLFLILSGFYILGWTRVLRSLERALMPIWKWVKPLARYVMPINSYQRAFTAGILWGFLPCGLLYSALMIAISRQSVLLSSVYLLLFGMGTLPSLLSLSWLISAPQFFSKNFNIRMYAGCILILMGMISFIWLWRHPIMQMGHCH